MNTSKANLRQMSAEQLVDFSVAIDRHPVSEARRLFPDRQKGYVRAAKDLSNWAWNRQAELTCRRTGDQTGEQIYGKICKDIYLSLPTWAKF